MCFSNVKRKALISGSAALNILMCGPWEETFAAASHQVNHQDDLADDDGGDDDYDLGNRENHDNHYKPPSKPPR